MGTLIDAYREMIDDGFHRGRFDRFDDYLTDDYTVIDLARPDRAGGVDGTRAHIARVRTGVRQLRYEILDAFEVGDRMAVRYLVTGEAIADGRRLVCTGISFHHGQDGRLRRSWNVGDQRDLGVSADDEPAPALVERWAGPPVPAEGVLARRYAALVERMYGGGAARHIDDLLHADYLPYDPFAARPGGDAAEGFHVCFRQQFDDIRYDVLDSFEVDDRLATRYLLRGVVGGAPATVIGLSINQARDGRFHRSWIYAQYGRVGVAARAAAAAAQAQAQATQAPAPAGEGAR